jgi:hypothetical protein
VSINNSYDESGPINDIDIFEKEDMLLFDVDEFEDYDDEAEVEDNDGNG